MHNQTLDFQFEVKTIQEDGLFSGYGSVFNLKDSYNEIVAPGAFISSLATQRQAGKMPAMLWQHRAAEPIGVYTDMQEDSIGLHVSGQIALKTVRGLEAYELLKMKAISGLSIGFTTREDSYDKVSGVRTLKQVDLWEVSLVTFPANDAARVNGIKNVEKIESLKDAEDYLRDSYGFSRAGAVALISRIKSLWQRDSGEGEASAIIEALNKRWAVFSA